MTCWLNSLPCLSPDLCFESLLSPDCLSGSLRPLTENTGQLSLNYEIGSYLPLILHKAASKMEESLTSDRIQDIDSPSVREATYSSTSSRHCERIAHAWGGRFFWNSSFLIWRKMAEHICQMFIIWPNFSRFERPRKITSVTHISNLCWKGGGCCSKKHDKSNVLLNYFGWS